MRAFGIQPSLKRPGSTVGVVEPQRGDDGITSVHLPNPSARIAAPLHNIRLNSAPAIKPTLDKDISREANRAAFSRLGPVRLPIQPARLIAHLAQGRHPTAPKTVAVDADHAKVVMKAYGGTAPVEFAVRREGDADQRMETLGTVMDTGEGRVFNWIAKLNQTVASAGFKRFPQLEIQADPGKKLTVSSTARASRPGIYSVCGPVFSNFVPERAKVYLVEFQFKGDRCVQQVFDVTDPANRVVVEGAGSEGKAG
jgi:hypothetical protein